MVEPAFSPLYIQARKVLLDVLEALVAQRSSLVVVGAQAVYLRTGASAIRSAPYTTDADLAVDPRSLNAEPELEKAMRDAGFELMEPDPGRVQPGLWHKQAGTSAMPIDVEVDLLVPAAFMPPTSARGARLPGHSKRAARITPGLEAALVDHAPLTITGLDPADQRSITVEVAGLAALLVAKLHKVNDRVQPGARADRQSDKDAADLVRIMLETSPGELIVTLRRLLDHPQAGVSTNAAVRFLRPLFATPRSQGVQMAIAALSLDVPAARVVQICTTFARELTERWVEHWVLKTLGDNTRRNVHQLFTVVDDPPASWTLSDVKTAVDALVEQELIDELPKGTGAGFGTDRIELPTVYMINQAGRDKLTEVYGAPREV